MQRMPGKRLMMLAADWLATEGVPDGRGRGRVPLPP